MAFGPGHNLGQMAAALPPDNTWVEKIRALDKHSPAATRYRYPSPTGRLFDPPDSQRLQKDIDELPRHLQPKGPDELLFRRLGT